MRLLVRGGTVVRPDALYRTDIISEEGRIESLSVDARTDGTDEVIEAEGMLVFPGFIDPHVHSRDPGMTEKEDFSHSTRAAAAGGICTILEMPNAIPPVTTGDLFRERVDHLSAAANVDFGLWGMTIGDRNIDDIPSLLAEGAIGIKLFWAYALDRNTWQLVYETEGISEEDIIPPLTTREVYEAMRAVARAGGLLAAHCEERGVLDIELAYLGKSLETYEDLLKVRSEGAEASSIALGIELSRATECSFHILHLSSARGTELLARARADGLRVTAETCPHYLFLASKDYSRLGEKMKAFPPIRGGEHQSALWDHIRTGDIDSISSDHAPHTYEEKTEPLDRQPAGNIGVETMARLMLDAAGRGMLSYQRIAWVLSEGTARLYGLHPQKGVLQAGSDADMTIVDPDQVWTIKNADLHSKNKLSLFDGFDGKGAPIITVVRGLPVMKYGELVRENEGRFVRPERGHQS